MSKENLVFYWKNGKLRCYDPDKIPIEKRLPKVFYKTGDLTEEEYLEYKREFEYSKRLKTIKISAAEYHGLTNALNLELSKEESKRAIIQKYYGNYKYTVVNNRDYTYRVVNKKMIESVYKNRRKKK